MPNPSPLLPSVNSNSQHAISDVLSPSILFEGLIDASHWDDDCDKLQQPHAPSGANHATEDTSDEDETAISASDLDPIIELKRKLAHLELSNAAINAENDQLKRDLGELAIEQLRIREASLQGSSVDSAETIASLPYLFKPTDFYFNVLHSSRMPSHRDICNDDGERLLAAGATWDMITNHELFKCGLVDIAEVSDILKSEARCDGQGPVMLRGLLLKR